jgi:hypothetical protein
MLSREAILILKPSHESSETGLTSPKYTPPTLSWLEGQWHVTHSTFPIRREQRNVRTVRKALAGDEKHFTSEVTYQSLDAEDIHTSLVDEYPTDLEDGRAAVFKQDGSAARWEALAWGKEGQLESWMIDTGDGWIADTSGERRGEWRNSYVVVYSQPIADGLGAGVEIWDRFGPQKPLSKETIRKIRDAIRGIQNPAMATLADSLVVVKTDKGRVADDQRRREQER